MIGSTVECILILVIGRAQRKEFVLSDDVSMAAYFKELETEMNFITIRFYHLFGIDVGRELRRDVT